MRRTSMLSQTIPFLSWFFPFYPFFYILLWREGLNDSSYDYLWGMKMKAKE